MLVRKHDATSLAALPPEAFSELHKLHTAIETALGTILSFRQINYLALMMVDPHVHFQCCRAMLMTKNLTAVFSGSRPGRARLT